MGRWLTVARKRAVNQRSLAYTLKIIQHVKETSVRYDSRVWILISVPRWDIFIIDSYTILHQARVLGRRRDSKKIKKK